MEQRYMLIYLWRWGTRYCCVQLRGNIMLKLCSRMAIDILAYLFNGGCLEPAAELRRSGTGWRRNWIAAGSPQTIHLIAIISGAGGKTKQTHKRSRHEWHVFSVYRVGRNPLRRNSVSPRIANRTSPCVGLTSTTWTRDYLGTNKNAIACGTPPLRRTAVQLRVLLPPTGAMHALYVEERPTSQVLIAAGHCSIAFRRIRR